MKNKVKIFLGSKRNKIMVIGIVVVIITVIFVALLFKKDADKFALNKIYDVLPEDVRELYANTVSVSCYGDLHLDITLDSEALKVENINKSNLIDYMFSNLDKANKLNNELTINAIRDTSKNLFNGNIQLDNLINNYAYNGYTYNIANDKITRTKSECVKDKEYVSHLFGYSYNVEELSIDVNIGYLKDGILYDLSDNKLGEYDGDAAKLKDLFIENSYYRYNYVLDNKTYKLNSVEWMSKI